MSFGGHCLRRSTDLATLVAALKTLTVSLLTVAALAGLVVRSRSVAATWQQVGSAQLYIVIEVHPELARGTSVKVLLEQIDLKHSAVPRQDVRIHRGGVNAHMDAQDVLKERHGGGVLPPFELPQLARRKHRHHQVPIGLGELRRIVDDVVIQPARVVRQVAGEYHVAFLHSPGGSLFLHRDVHTVQQEVLHVVQRDARGQRGRYNDNRV
mmetsp:Transcript_63945/g.112933  ORF Transcript_63945/g.112933 Transcript_63945/m.112933 type:complete len:210 (+) Transcript_63945:88-717(+)